MILANRKYIVNTNDILQRIIVWQLYVLYYVYLFLTSFIFISQIIKYYSEVEWNSIKLDKVANKLLNLDKLNNMFIKYQNFIIAIKLCFFV